MISMSQAAAWALAALCAALMGFSIQRGATCTVAAVDELVSRRQSSRLRAFAEAALWVALGLLLARGVGLLPQLPPGFGLSGWTFAGAALLGLGAFINRACVFGAIARLGNGEWAYAATPLGFYIGCLAMGPLLGAMGSPSLAAALHPLATPAPVLALLALLSVPASLLVSLLMGGPMLWRGLAMLRARQWTPAAATAVIGLTFLAMVLLVGTWAYTDALAELARGMSQSVGLRIAFFICLLGGAMFGGLRAGRWRPAWPAATDWLRCFIGGAAMAAGSAFIPGSNDGLILVGMPLLWPYAWVAFLTMCASIAAALWLQRRRRLASSDGSARAVPPASSTVSSTAAASSASSTSPQGQQP